MSHVKCHFENTWMGRGDTARIPVVYFEVCKSFIYSVHLLAEDDDGLQR